MPYSRMMDLVLDRVLEYQNRNVGATRKTRESEAERGEDERCAELEEMLIEARDENARLNAEAQPMAQKWNLSKDEMDQFEELVEPHQNTIDTTAKARQQLYDDVFKAYNAYAPRLFVAVKPEKFDIEEEKAKLSKLQAELKALKAKERRVLNHQAEYDSLCKFEEDFIKKKSGGYDDNAVSSNQS